MAKMVPAQIPELLVIDRKRRAERFVYEALAKELSDDFVVYWSRPWHRFRPDGTGQDGEVDFVIAHPDLGVLSIEVKGGVVSCDDQGQWCSQSKAGVVYNISNPVFQAAKGKHRLLELLKKHRKLSRRYIHLCHGVILPDNARPSHDLGADAPLELFAFGNDLAANKLGAWIRSRLENGAKACDPLGADGMRVLHEIVASSFELRPHLAASLADDMKKIELLTSEQAHLLDAIGGNSQMAVAGAAGTGKTLLALEKAMRCAESGQRTLLTCYNNALAAYLKRLVGHVENLTIASFHEFCGMMAHAANIPLPSQTVAAFYDDILPSALDRALSERVELRLDAIVVDEGQDFRDSWLYALQLSLIDAENGCFHVFYDDNQRIYGTDRGFIEALPKANHRLNRNLRNTRSIHQSLRPWCDTQNIISAGPRGEPVQWTEAKGRDQAYAFASAFVSDLVKTEQLRIEDIAILTGGSRDDCGLFKQAKIAGATLVKASEAKNGGSLVCDTVRRFKGLEARCVVLVDIDQLKIDELIYVALSRPSLLLKIIGPVDDIKRINLAI
jgi:hypothetical protein